MVRPFLYQLCPVINVFRRHPLKVLGLAPNNVVQVVKNAVAEPVQNSAVVVPGAHLEQNFFVPAAELVH